MSKILSAEQTWTMFRLSIVIPKLSCIRLIRSIGNRFLQDVILYNVNFMKRMAWKSSFSSSLWIAKAQMNLAKMMVTSLPFEIMAICAPNPSLRNPIYDASDSCKMYMKNIYLKMAASSGCPILNGWLGFIRLAKTIYLRSGSVMRRFRSKF